MVSTMKTMFYISKPVAVILGAKSHNDEISRQVKNWIWFLLVQRKLDKFVDCQNAHHIQKQTNTALPSGGRPDQFYNCPSNYGGLDCLIPVDKIAVDELLEECGEGILKM